MEQRTRPAHVDPRDRRIRRTWLLFAAAFALFAVVLIGSLVADGFGPWDLVMAGLLGLVGAAAGLHWAAVRDTERDRRGEVEGFARILRGLSRSVSPDAIVGAIARELGEVTGADHVVVVRKPPDSTFVEATLVSMRAGVPDVTTVLTGVDLDAQPAWTLERDDGPGIDGSDPELSSLDPRGDPVAVPISVEDAVAARARSSGHGRGAAATAWSGPERRSEARRASAGRIGPTVRSAFGLSRTISSPLRADGRVVGAIVLSRRSREPWPSSAERLLAAATAEASAALSRAYSFRQAQARATTDALTGLPNRAYFDELCGLLARRRRADDAVGILMVDIDHFKALNDRHGHDMGDDVLREVATAIAGAVREVDVPARYGGEEFVVLLRNPGDDVAVEVGERVRTAVGALDLRDPGIASISVSVGVAVQDGPDEPIDSIIQAADRALYRAKRQGRDRVVAA